MMADDHKKKLNMDKKLVKGAVSLATAGAVLIGGLFNAPSDILTDEQIAAPTAIVEMIDTDPGDDGGGDEDIGEETEEKRGIRAKLRKFFLRQPVMIRLLFVLPAWLMGWGIIAAVSALSDVFMVPVLGAVLKWLLITALTFGCILLAVKALYPDLPLKQLLTKKNIFLFFAAGALLGVVGAVIGLVWPEKRYISALVDSGAAAAMLAVFGIKAKILSPGKDKTE